MTLHAGTYPMAWPDPIAPRSVRGRFGYEHHYQTPEGEFVSVTSYLQCLGLGKQGLIHWSANVEHEAMLEAAVMTWDEQEYDTPAEFAAAIEERVGKTRAHVKKLEKAADIGSNVHEYIQWFHSQELGIRYPEPALKTDEATVAWMAYEDQWRQSGMKAVRVEQTVWDRTLATAGKLDLIVEHPERGRGVRDFKSSKGVYDEHHIQLAVYCRLARNWNEIDFAEIVHLPKTIENVEVKVVELGDLEPHYGTTERRYKTEAELLQSFMGAQMVYRVHS